MRIGPTKTHATCRTAFLLRPGQEATIHGATYRVASGGVSPPQNLKNIAKLIEGITELSREDAMKGLLQLPYSEDTV